MTELTQAAKQRACDLANARAPGPRLWSPANVDDPQFYLLTTLAQLCQDISDVVKQRYEADKFFIAPVNLRPFLLPDEPDVLAEAWADTCKIIGHGEHPSSRFLPVLRTALAQRGHEVAPIKELP